MAASETWSDPYECPFCGGTLPSPGEGFVRHIDNNESCNERFEQWRGRVSDDMVSGWAG